VATVGWKSHLSIKAPNLKNQESSIFTGSLGFTQKPPNSLGRGLDESKELGILIDGLGVDQAVAGASQSGRREGSSQRKIKRRPEVDPIVRFFTSTG
jgi:hypothetical protein